MKQISVSGYRARWLYVHVFECACFWIVDEGGKKLNEMGTLEMSGRLQWIDAADRLQGGLLLSNTHCSLPVW